tara:strand:- start:15456 stop:17144 length:1689 start_codon:yes stop_codon:yes gene_type:complete
MIIKQTTLDLNGPELTFTTHPSSATINQGGSTTMTGTAVAAFSSQDPPNPATNTGSISYQWYAINIFGRITGPLEDGTNSSLGVTLSGTNTNTLSISNASIPNANGVRFYLVADYVPSAYSQPEGSAVVVGTARSTGNAFNDPKSSNTATLTVNPTLTLTSNPSSREIAENQFETFSASASASDGSSVSIQWQLNGSDLSDSSTVSGSRSNTLRISRPSAGTYYIRAKFTHPTASNSPIYSSTATFNVVLARAILNYEVFSDSGTSASTGQIDLAQQGGDSYIFRAGGGSEPWQTTCIYAPERDINVEIELAGARGHASGTKRGGYGGVTRFRFQLQQNTEYVLKIGHTYGYGVAPTGGVYSGGGMTIFYRGAHVVAAAGGGGGAAAKGKGGHGGGAGQSGADGEGRGGGNGGRSVGAGSLPYEGSFAGRVGLDDVPTSTNGGWLSSCTWGGWWRTTQGKSPCQALGKVYMYNARGDRISNTTNNIERGFKPGKAFRNNGGRAQKTQDGAGGSGAYGGDAAKKGSSHGGGGGSGYWNGEGQLMLAQRGSNNDVKGYVKITVV